MQSAFGWLVDNYPRFADWMASLRRAATLLMALDHLEAAGHHIDAMRVRAFPFGQEVYDFIHAHDEICVVEQNRDAQLRSLLMIEGGRLAQARC